MSDAAPAKCYVDDIQLNNLSALEVRFKELLQQDIQCAGDLETWVNSERAFLNEVGEAMAGHVIDFYCDTADAKKREIHMHDQLTVAPVLLHYEAKLDRKFCDCPFVAQLDDRKYGLMRQTRRTKVNLFREQNIPLMVREQELGAKYSETMGGLTIQWEGEEKPYPFVMALLDHPDRAIRERAWKAGADARGRVKAQMDDILNELVLLRHQIAVNAGFENYRDYMFQANNREYSVQDCYDFHAAVEKFVVPANNRLNDVFRRELGVANFRPWDYSTKLLGGTPFSTVTELIAGVQDMLSQADPVFAERFRHMREHGLLDLDVHPGKSPGGFCTPLPVSRDAFIFANFSPSFFAIIALIHEMGHAVNFYAQLESDGFREGNFRMEVAELYSHGMELLLCDKLNRFYPGEREFRVAQRDVLRRACGMLIGPLSGDLFQHWLYTHPDHTVEERDQKYIEVMKRFALNAVDTSGVEFGIASNWFAEPHIIVSPFYHIEYSISELGALQLFQIYQKDAKQALDLYKQGASADFEQSIAEIYHDTGVEFDFSEPVIRRTAEFLERVILELG